MTDEFFFSMSLEGAKDSKSWNPAFSEKGESLQGNYKLIIKQVLVGPEAPDGEVNVVQVKTKTYWNKSVKIPIASLKAGGANNHQVLLDTSFFSPVTFKLRKGSGPVHILGQYLRFRPTEKVDEMVDVEEEMIVDEEEDEGSDEDDEDYEPKRKKAKIDVHSKDKAHVKINIKTKKQLFIN